MKEKQEPRFGLEQTDLVTCVKLHLEDEVDVRNRPIGKRCKKYHSTVIGDHFVQGQAATLQ